MGPEIFNPENAKTYGQWIGARYKDRKNIIWIMGGDRNPRNEADLALAEDLRKELLAERTLPALISEPQETLQLGAGGFTASGNFTVKLLRNNLPAIPVIGETLAYAGETFRIVRVSNRPPHPLVTLTVEPVE